MNGDAILTGRLESTNGLDNFIPFDGSPLEFATRNAQLIFKKSFGIQSPMDRDQKRPHRTHAIGRKEQHVQDHDQIPHTPSGKGTGPHVGPQSISTRCLIGALGQGRPIQIGK
eukprot:scaffold54795_cov47-Attheya_sp.AAC.1